MFEFHLWGKNPSEKGLLKPTKPSSATNKNDSKDTQKTGPRKSYGSLTEKEETVPHPKKIDSSIDSSYQKVTRTTQKTTQQQEIFEEVPEITTGFSEPRTRIPKKQTSSSTPSFQSNASKFKFTADHKTSGPPSSNFPGIRLKSSPQKQYATDTTTNNIESFEPLTELSKGFPRITSTPPKSTTIPDFLSGDVPESGSESNPTSSEESTKLTYSGGRFS